MEKILLKLFLSIVMKKRNEYARIVKFKGENYIITAEKYISISESIKEFRKEKSTPNLQKIQR